MIVLGIDPGSVCTGYGVIEVDGRALSVCGHGTIRPSGTHLSRLKRIYAAITEVVQEFAPDTCAVEMPVYAKNAQAMLKLGRAQAAAMLAAAHQDLEVAQYTPKEVKRAVTGSGAASKEQVAFMVRSLLKVRPDGLDSQDASDALAVALCHRHRKESGVAKPVYADWAAFVRQNPDRTI